MSEGFLVAITYAFLGGIVLGLRHAERCWKGRENRLVLKYKRRWQETMPDNGRETEQAFLHGQHWEVGEILRDLNAR